MCMKRFNCSITSSAHIGCIGKSVKCKNSGWRRLWRSILDLTWTYIIIFNGRCLKRSNISLTLIKSIRCAIFLCCALQNLVHPIEPNPWSSCRTCNTFCYLFLKIFFLHLVPFVMTLSCYHRTFCRSVSQAFSKCFPNPWFEKTQNQMSNISPHTNPTKLTKHHLTIVLPSHLSYFDEIDLVELWQMHLQVMQAL